MDGLKFGSDPPFGSNKTADRGTPSAEAHSPVRRLQCCLFCALVRHTRLIVDETFEETRHHTLIQAWSLNLNSCWVPPWLSDGLKRTKLTSLAKDQVICSRSTKRSFCNSHDACSQSRNENSPQDTLNASGIPQ